jgi:hypothetical protein
VTPRCPGVFPGERCGNESDERRGGLGLDLARLVPGRFALLDRLQKRPGDRVAHRIGAGIGQHHDAETSGGLQVRSGSTNQPSP